MHAQAAIEGRARLGESWADDPVTKAGIAKLVESTTEEMRSIDTEIQAQFPDIAWSQIRGTRNRISHGYHRIDVEIVDDIVGVDLPKLIAQIDQMLEALK